MATVLEKALFQQLRGLSDLEASVVSFARACGFEPDNYQTEAMEDKSQRQVYLWARRCGKTAVTSIIALHTALFTKNSTVLIVSPSIDKSKEMILELRLWYSNFITTHPGFQVDTDAESKTELSFKGGGRILCRAATGGSLRGFGSTICIVDEAALVESAIIDEVLTPTLATTHGRIVLISTPGDIGTSFHRAYMFGLQKKKWSLHGPIESVQCPRVDKEFLKDEMDWMTSDAFDREYRAKWVGAANMVFPVDWLQKIMLKQAVLYDPEVHGRCVCGVDLAKTVDRTVFCAISRVTGEVVGLEEHQREAYPEQESKLRQFVRRYNVDEVMVDQSGVGEGVVDHLLDDGVGCDIRGYKITFESKVELIKNLQVYVEKEKVKIPPETFNEAARHLYNELLIYRYEKPSASGNVRTSAPEGRHDDHVIALALGCILLREGIGAALIETGGAFDNW